MPPPGSARADIQSRQGMAVRFPNALDERGGPSAFLELPEPDEDKGGKVNPKAQDPHRAPDRQKSFLRCGSMLDRRASQMNVIVARVSRGRSEVSEQSAKRLLVSPAAVGGGATAGVAPASSSAVNAAASAGGMILEHAGSWVHEIEREAEAARAPDSSGGGASRANDEGDGGKMSHTALARKKSSLTRPDAAGAPGKGARRLVFSNDIAEVIEHETQKARRSLASQSTFEGSPVPRRAPLLVPSMTLKTRDFDLEDAEEEGKEAGDKNDASGDDSARHAALMYDVRRMSVKLTVNKMRNARYMAEQSSSCGTLGYLGCCVLPETR